MFPEPVTNVRKYKRCKRQMPRSLVTHFPNSVPESATDPVFYYAPGMLQASTILQLRVYLPEREILELTESLEDAVAVYEGGGRMFDHYNEDQDNNLPTTAYRTARKSDGVDALGFPEHFTMYVLSAKGRQSGWNHGTTTGIGISTETNDVIYWAEAW